MKILDGVTSDAYFSECRTYRYWLTRTWNANLPTIAFVGLNPSVASLEVDDNTVRKCQVFARNWGYGRLLMLNLYAWRATDPKVMFKAKKDGFDIIGGVHNCFSSLQRYMLEFGAKRTVAAWGTNGGERGREAERSLDDLWCFSKNADRSPEHPLYVPYSTPLQPFNFSARAE